MLCLLTMAFWLQAGPSVTTSGQADELEGTTQLSQSQLEVVGRFLSVIVLSICAKG